MDDMTPEERKQIVKEALKEWLDDRVRDFGWFAIKTLVGLAFSVIVYLAFHLGIIK